VIDIPNAFIQTRIEDEKDMAIIKIRGVLVDILVDIAPDVYKPYATKDKKETVDCAGSERAVRYHGRQSSLLPQVHAEPDGRRI
jgi:hypothetical protein